MTIPIMKAVNYTLFIIVILYSFTPIIDAALPRGCRCLTSCKIMDCSSANLFSVPRFEEVTRKEMTSLNLRNNSIASITFGHIYRNLFLLDVSFSQVKQISMDLDTYLPKLEYLHLRGNQLTSFAWFSPLQRTRLITIDLQNNQIGSLNTPDIPHFQFIQQMDISYNNIVDLSPVSKWTMQALTDLNFSGNKVTDVRDISFPNNILKLDLSNNRLREVKTRLPRVQLLSLSNNELKSLMFLIQDRSAFLWKVDLAHNRFVCNCDLYRQKTAIKNQGVVFGDNSTCSYPDGRLENLITLSDKVCQVAVKNICNKKSNFIYTITEFHLKWNVATEFKGTNVSWSITDANDRIVASDWSTKQTVDITLPVNATSGPRQLCVHLFGESVSCLHSCRLLISKGPIAAPLVWGSMQVQLLLGVGGGILLLLLVLLLVLLCCTHPCCPRRDPTATYGSVYQVPVRDGSLQGLQITESKSGLTVPVQVIPVRSNSSMVLTNGNQTVPSRHFVRRPTAERPATTLGARRGSLFRSERCLAPREMTRRAEAMSMDHLNFLSASRPSLASRELPEPPFEPYVEMDEGRQSTEGMAYEMMQDNMRPPVPSRRSTSLRDRETYQELNYLNHTNV